MTAYEMLERHNTLLRTRAERAEAEASRYLHAINWALGCNGSFRSIEPGEGPFYWRTELAERACVRYSPERECYLPLQSDPPASESGGGERCPEEVDAMKAQEAEARSHGVEVPEDTTRATMGEPKMPHKGTCEWCGGEINILGHNYKLAMVHKECPAPADRPDGDMRRTLITQVHELIDQIERTLHLFGDDAEARAQAEGAIRYARKTIEPYDYNGADRPEPTVPWRAITQYIDEQADEYEMRADNGDYTPTGHERLLMRDFAHGIVDEVVRRALSQPAPTEPTGEALAAIEDAFTRCAQTGMSDDAWKAVRNLRNVARQHLQAGVPEAVQSALEQLDNVAAEARKEGRALAALWIEKAAREARSALAAHDTGIRDRLQRAEELLRESLPHIPEGLEADARAFLGEQS